MMSIIIKAAGGLAGWQRVWTVKTGETQGRTGREARSEDEPWPDGQIVE